MSKWSGNYRAEFRTRHGKTKHALRKADKAAVIAVERARIVADPPRTKAQPGSTREAQRRLRQIESRKNS